MLNEIETQITFLFNTLFHR